MQCALCQHLPSGILYSIIQFICDHFQSSSKHPFISNHPLTQVNHIGCKLFTLLCASSRTELTWLQLKEAGKAWEVKVHEWFFFTKGSTSNWNRNVQIIHDCPNKHLKMGSLVNYLILIERNRVHNCILAWAVKVLEGFSTKEITSNWNFQQFSNDSWSPK